MVNSQLVLPPTNLQVFRLVVDSRALPVVEITVRLPAAGRNLDKALPRQAEGSQPVRILLLLPRSTLHACKLQRELKGGLPKLLAQKCRRPSRIEQPPIQVKTTCLCACYNSSSFIGKAR